jgi:hypothetical protein
VDSDTTDVSADKFHLAHVDASTDAEAISASGSPDSARTKQRSRWSVEGRKYAVAGRMNFTPVEPLEFRPGRFEMCREQLPPTRITEARRLLG